MTQSVEVAVALVGGGVDLEAFDEDCTRAYADRPKTVVTAGPSDSLATVLGVATDRFRLTHPGNYASAGRSLDFYRGDPSETVIPTLPTTQTVTITDPSGLAVWHVAPEDASIQELVQAHQRKVFDGDPLRPYLLVDPQWQMGGPTPGGWNTFLQIWATLLFARGSWDVLRTMVRISKETLELLDRAVGRWQDHRSAALYTRDLFEDRGADIMDVISTTRAAMTYQLADLMAWTGIDDPAIAACVAGWAGYELDESSRSLSMMSDVELRALVSEFPISLSIDLLTPEDEDAHAEVMRELARFLVEQGQAHPQ